MNTSQYLTLGMSAVVIVGTPFLVAKVIRRKQWYRLFEIFISGLIVLYLTEDVVWPFVLHSSPPLVHRLAIILIAVWIADFFGITKRLINWRKAAKFERSQS